MAKIAAGLCNHASIYTNGDEQVAEQVAKVIAYPSNPPTLFTVDARGMQSLVKGKQDAEVIMMFQNGTV
jgi:hypothetical protein